MKFTEWLDSVSKAIAGGVAASATQWTAANMDGTVTMQEFVSVAGAFLLGAVLVWLVPNSGVTKPTE